MARKKKETVDKQAAALAEKYFGDATSSVENTKTKNTSTKKKQKKKYDADDPNKIYFSIPDFWNHFQLNMMFIHMFNEQREKFRDNVVIDSIFGNFPCIWNGGRTVSGHTSLENIVNTIKPFNELGVSVRYTFNNLLLEEKHMGDTIGNAMLEITKGYNEEFGVHNGCTISTQVLMDHIRTNYPQFRRVWSTTLGEEDIDVINKKLETDEAVLSYTLNNKWDILKQIKHPEKVELLCMDEGCLDNCPYRKDHYMWTDEITLCMPHTHTKTNFDLSGGQCYHPKRTQYYYTQHATQKYVIPYDLMMEKYVPAGFNKMKISGRSPAKQMTINIIENYTNFLAKPEYKDDVRNMLLINAIDIGEF